MLCRIFSWSAEASPIAEPGWAFGWRLAFSALYSLGPRASLTVRALLHLTPLQSGYGNICVHFWDFLRLINRSLKNSAFLTEKYTWYAYFYLVHVFISMQNAYLFQFLPKVPTSNSSPVNILQNYWNELFNASDTVMCNPCPIL